METSPLAAIQPDISAPFSRRYDPTDFSSNFLRPSYCQQKPFELRDLSMEDPKPDYFSLNPVRGSSPTASLAADLSQNFHIAQRYAQALGAIFEHD